MLIQIILTVWLLALIFLTNRFRREGRIAQQRLFSVFLIVWAILGIMYYDVLMLTTGQLEGASSTQWQTYLPVVFFSICAGMGTYYLMMTFGKFRAADEKNRKRADQELAAKQTKKQTSKKPASGKKY